MLNAFALDSPTLEEFLLELSLGDLDLNSLVDLLGVALFVVCIVLDCGRKECVDERGLSQARFASNLDNCERAQTIALMSTVP